MRSRSILIISFLVLTCCLTTTIAAENVVTIIPSAPVVGDKVTVTPKGDIEVDPDTWKIKSPTGDFSHTTTSTGINFTPDKEGAWEISFSWNFAGLDDPVEKIITIPVKTKSAETETDNKQPTAETKESQFQARVNKLLKDSLVYYFDENYSKNVMTLAKEIEGKIPQIKKVTKKEQITELLDNVEKEFLENELKDKSDDVKNAWKNFFNALRRRYEITLKIFTEKKVKINQFGLVVQSFVDALRASAVQELTRIQNYEVNRATYLNYMNKYSNTTSKFKKHHKFRRYQKHKFYFYKN